MKTVLLLLIGFLISTPTSAVVLPGLVDLFGNPVHSEDEVDVQIESTVQKVPQGYRYTYTLTSMQSSKQNLVQFEVYLPDPYSSVVPGFESSPWLNSKGNFPNDPSDPPPHGFVYSPEVWSIGWVALYPQFEIQPGGMATGFTFVSPYPPGNAEGYISGSSNPPVTAEDGTGAPEFYYRSKYGSGKIAPVIGPVKPTTPNVTDNYSVIGCAGGLCDVQLDITGPQDPYGTAYTYTWSGAFGTATGAKPIVQLAAGVYTVSVAVSDPYATLVTATMPITVIDPNPPVVTPPTGGGNTGGGAGNGGNNQGGGAGQGTGSNAGNGNTDGNNQGVNGNVGTGSNDMDHDDDRDGDGKPNSEDLNPDHPD